MSFPEINARSDDVTGFSVTLTSFDGRSVDITDLVHTVQIYQSLFTPTMTGKIVLQDRANFISTLPLTGEESINIKFSSEGSNGTDVDTTFFGYRLDEGTFQADLSGLSYVMYLVSNEGLIDTFQPVSKSYASTIDQMVSDVYTNILKTKKPLMIEKTAGIHQFTIPRKTALQTLQMFAKYAVSAETSASAFFNFENFNGFNFRSIEGLVSFGKQVPQELRYRLHHSLTVDQTMESAANDVIHMRMAKKYDTLDLMKQGYFFSSAHSFDMLAKEVEDKDFVLNDNFPKWTTTEKRPLHTNKFIEAYGANSAKRFLIPFDSSKPNPEHADAIGAKNAYISNMLQNQYEAIVPGNARLNAGTVIHVTVPELAPPEQRSGVEMTEVSGPFLVCDVVHTIQTKTKIFSKLHIVKDSYSES